MNIISLLTQKVMSKSMNIVDTWKNKTLLFNPFKTKTIKIKTIDILYPVKHWLDNIEVKNSSTAHFICQLIPSQCPFAKQIKFHDRTLITIPPLCKLNPLYGNLMDLKFRCLTYLADTCGEDISAYC